MCIVAVMERLDASVAEDKTMQLATVRSMLFMTTTRRGVSELEQEIKHRHVDWYVAILLALCTVLEVQIRDFHHLRTIYIWNEPLLRVALSESSWIVNLVYQLIVARSVFATLRFPTFNAFTDSPDDNSRSFYLLIIRAATVLSSLKSECQLGYFTIS